MSNNLEVTESLDAANIDGKDCNSPEDELIETYEDEDEMPIHCPEYDGEIPDFINEIKGVVLISIDERSI